jgi:UDP-hydrolysing UDP-N-acetyl-D-glucosamine 2-epimerase
MVELRKICVLTGTRAEYGLLKVLMNEIESDESIELQVIVTGTHLSPEFGSTVNEIISDGFSEFESVEMLLASDSRVGVAKSMALGLIGFAEALDRLEPDVLVLLGDRFEILAAAEAALLARVPIAHIHGGEITEGAIDDSIRHAVTKMSHWHFVANATYKTRVEQLGEDPDSIFDYGAPGLDGVEKPFFEGKTELEEFLGLDLSGSVFVATYHPATLGDVNPLGAFKEFLLALEEFPQHKVVFTFPNSDVGGKPILQELKRWVERNRARSVGVASLGHRRYLSLMSLSSLVIGNSSSGIIEAPFLSKATVNIGPRQDGRMMAESIVSCDETAIAITTAIELALSAEHQAKVSVCQTHYGDGSASQRIKEQLKVVHLPAYRKKFHDLSVL